MKLSPDSIPGLLRLLLLAVLFVHTSSRPTHSSSLCAMFSSMSVHVEKLMTLSKDLHGLSDEQLLAFASMTNKLHDLPHIKHTADHLISLKVNASLSQFYVYTQSFTLHVDWLKTAKENLNLSSQSTEGFRSHLMQLSNLLNASIHQISAEVPQSPSAAFPVISTAFDVLEVSIEIADQLQVFCYWSKTVLRHIQNLSRCPRH